MTPVLGDDALIAALAPATKSSKASWLCSKEPSQSSGLATTTEKSIKFARS